MKAPSPSKLEEVHTPKGSSSGLSSLVPYDETPEPATKQQSSGTSPKLSQKYANFVGPQPEKPMQESVHKEELPPNFIGPQLVEEKKSNLAADEDAASKDVDSLDGVEMEDADSSELPGKVAPVSQPAATDPDMVSAPQPQEIMEEEGNDFDVDDFDFDDIDQQLDLALERKTVSVVYPIFALFLFS